jgi:signal transduction histidine kinase
MFRPFDRSEDAIGRPGLGLGLAVARSFARAQGGELELESDDRPGATFLLTLPRA